MPNPFAGNKSGMQSMFESILPPDVLDAIKLAKEQLPTVIDKVQESVKRIEDKLTELDIRTLHILASVEVICSKLDVICADIEPGYVPDILPSQVVEANHKLDK